MKEIQEKKSGKDDAKAAKEEKKRLADEFALKKKSTPGKDWFRVFETDTYSKFNDDGMPTHDKAGKEINP